MSEGADGLMMEPRAEAPPPFDPTMPFAGPQEPAGGLEAFGGRSMPDTSGPGPTANQEPARWVYDFDPATGQSRATFNGLVNFTEGGSESAGVTSWNGQTGAVVMQASDIEAAGGLANPDVALEGVPTAPTASPGASTTQIATTQFVAQAIVAGAGVTTFNGRVGAVTLTQGDVTGAGGAPTISPALTGVPTTPTASQGTANSQIASTMFVSNAIASGAVTSFNGRQGGVTLSLSDVESVGGAPISSPTFTGLPLVPTAPPGTATTQAASTAFVTNAIVGATTGVSSVNTRTGAVVLNASDLAGMGGAPLISPAFTSQPTAPTPSAGDNSTRIATTAYVETAIGSLPSGVSTFNGRTGTVTLDLTDVTSVGGAPLASPVFTGSPLTTTPPPGDNSTRVADTAFVAAAIGALPAPPAASTTNPLVNGTAAPGSSVAWSRGDHVHPTDTTRAAQASLASYAPLAGASFTGGISAPSATVTGTLGAAAVTVTGGVTANAINVVNNGGISLGGSFGSASLYVPSGGPLTIANTLSGVTANIQLDVSNNFIFNSGSGSAIKPGGGPWSAPSDERIKTVERAYDLGLAEVLRLDPVVYRYKGNDGDPNNEASIRQHRGLTQTDFVGLVAQAVEPIFPGMVAKGRGFIDGEEVDDLRMLDTTELIFALVNAVKTLAARVSDLEAA